jgi:hypothetical protein
MSIAKPPAAIANSLTLLARQAGKMPVVALIGTVALLAPPEYLGARTLNDRDFENVSQIERSFRSVMRELTEASQLPNVVPAEAECIRNTLQNLAQASDELSKYEYLITIEKQINDSSDDDAMKDVVKFAIDKALEILKIERRHMARLSDQCSKFPMYSGQNKRAVQFIDSTMTTLQSILGHL